MPVTVYERILDLLEAEGINTLFGIPDPGFIHMAMTAEGRGWNVIAPHHEQAGGFMADAWSRMTGKPGVCFGTQGPGVTNLAAAMIVAAKENSPTIFFGGQRSRIAYQRVRRGRIQYLDQLDYFKPAMKFAGSIEEPEQVDEIVRQAIRAAMSGTPGPCYIELPLSVIHETYDWAPVLPPEAYRLVHQAASAPTVEQALDLIRSAKNPVILAGQGVFTARSQGPVGELAALMACPLLQTSGAAMVIPGLEETTFAYGFSPAGNAAAEASDLCIAIGTELGEPLHMGVGRHWAKNDKNRKWIYIERDATAIGINRPIDVPLVGDLRDIVPQLVEGLKATPRSRSAEFEGWIELQARFKAETLASVPVGMTPVHPARFVVEATAKLPKETILVRDGGSTAIFGWTFSQFQASDIVWNQNTGHLGTGLPYAIGAAIATEGKRPVVLITGDSSFLFHIAEIETAVRKGLPLVTVVACDYAWGLEVGCWRKQVGPQSPETEAHWGKWVRFDKAAEAFGAIGEYVEREEDIWPAVERAIASGKPAVIHVPVDADVNAMDAPNYDEFKSWYTDFKAGYGSDV
ncbi:MAG TPA: thiamine pyrophosphate-binding protein [Sphingobium sp.]|uniref:thiamine pyrophosphate-binding protein n=1 Tax=Sphingobium sp. TaxID=1912891 RepID=UPI002ED1DDD5